MADTGPVWFTLGSCQFSRGRLPPGADLAGEHPRWTAAPTIFVSWFDPVL